ncbi:MAG: TRAP transporter substrate-binding protein [Geminicoccaceae bacterium]|nr:TRAP transporter substrate-binding protein [Geminicoccaceae bacterium]
MSKSGTTTTLAASAFLLSSVFLSATAQAETRWIMASGYPEDSFFTRNIRMFIDDVKEATGGELVIDLRSNDSLIKHDAIKRAVQVGQVQAGEIRLSVYGNENIVYGLDSIPNLVTTYDEAWKLMEAQDPYFQELFQKDGMRIVTYVCWPGQGFYTAEPVNSLADLEGQSLRIYSPQTQEMGEKLGMDATILPFAEVPQAFSTGLIEALWTSAQTGTDVQAWDYVDYFTYTGSLHTKNAVILNGAAFDALSPEHQQAVLDAAAEATERGWAMSKEAGEEKEKVLADHGMTIAQAPDDVMQKMREIGKEMVAQWRAEADTEQVAVLEAYEAAIGR